MKELATKRAIILKHYQNPYHWGLVDDESYLKANRAADSCLDDITVQLSLVDSVIKDVRFGGKGCAIAIASTSIIASLINGRSTKDAECIIAEYFKMLAGQPYRAEILGDALALAGIAEQPGRLNCALIGVKSFADLLKVSQGAN